MTTFCFVNFWKHFWNVLKKEKRISQQVFLYSRPPNKSMKTFWWFYNIILLTLSIQIIAGSKVVFSTLIFYGVFNTHKTWHFETDRLVTSWTGDANLAKTYTPKFVWCNEDSKSNFVNWKPDTNLLNHKTLEIWKTFKTCKIFAFALILLLKKERNSFSLVVLNFRFSVDIMEGEEGWVKHQQLVIFDKVKTENKN